MAKFWFMIPLAAALGFFAGFAGRWSREKPPAVETIAAVETRPAARPDDGTGEPALSPAKPAPLMKSADTLGELLALDDSEGLYARLALWQLDAPESELADFWAGYRTREKRDTGVIDLLFSQWTRTNPLAAVEAAKGSGHEGIPWWAWAVNDPAAAVAAARGASKEMAGFVMRAIGQFHPEQAMRVLAENPDFAQGHGIEGIGHGMTRTDPEAALAFLRKHGRMHDTDAIKKLTRDDPQAALEWLRKESRGDDSYSGQAVLRTLERENPELLAELAAGTPSGELKWKLESAAFRHLAAGNPAEALSQARAAGSPRVAAERLAVIGRGMVEDDPQGALAIFQELFEACPDATSRAVVTRYPNGDSSSGGGMVDGVEEFVSGLVAEDPRAAMAAAGPEGATEIVTRSWVAQDVNAFAEWLRREENALGYDQGAVIIAEHLSGQEDFAGALGWAIGAREEATRHLSTTNAFQQWVHRDREAALEWSEQTELPDDLRKALEPYLPRE